MEGAIDGMLEGLVVGPFVGDGNSTISDIRTNGRSVPSGPRSRVSVGSADSVGNIVGKNIGVCDIDGPDEGNSVN